LGLLLDHGLSGGLPAGGLLENGPPGLPGGGDVLGLRLTNLGRVDGGGELGLVLARLRSHVYLSHNASTRAFGLLYAASVEWGDSLAGAARNEFETDRKLQSAASKVSEASHVTAASTTCNQLPAQAS